MTAEQIEQKIREWKVLRETNRLIVSDPQIDRIIHERIERLSHRFEVLRAKEEKNKKL